LPRSPRPSTLYPLCHAHPHLSYVYPHLLYAYPHLLYAHPQLLYAHPYLSNTHLLAQKLLLPRLCAIQLRLSCCQRGLRTLQLALGLQDVITV